MCPRAPPSGGALLFCPAQSLCLGVSFSTTFGGKVMNAPATANLVGITGIARRLVQDGAMDEAAARSAMAQASEAKVPLAQFIADKKLVGAAQLAAANSIEFGVPLLDASVFDTSQNAMKLV